MKESTGCDFDGTGTNPLSGSDSEAFRRCLDPPLRTDPVLHDMPVVCGRRAHQNNPSV